MFLKVYLTYIIKLQIGINLHLELNQSRSMLNGVQGQSVRRGKKSKPLCMKVIFQ